MWRRKRKIHPILTDGGGKNTEEDEREGEKLRVKDLFAGCGGRGKGKFGWEVRPEGRGKNATTF